VQPTVLFQYHPAVLADLLKIECNSVSGIEFSFSFSETESDGARKVSQSGFNKAGFLSTAQPMLKTPAGLETKKRCIKPWEERAQLIDPRTSSSSL